MNFKDCVDEFFVEEMQCRLPWTHHHDKIGLRNCQTENDLEVYRNLTIDITSTHLRQKLVKKGCFRPNCRQTTWAKNQYATRFKTDEDNIELWIFLPSTAKVTQRKELLLADFSTFLADCGSYLGLFLGASVLSMTDTAFLSIKRAFKTMYDVLKKLNLFRF